MSDERTGQAVEIVSRREFKDDKNDDDGVGVDVGVGRAAIH